VAKFPDKEINISSTGDFLRIVDIDEMSTSWQWSKRGPAIPSGSELQISDNGLRDVNTSSIEVEI